MTNDERDTQRKLRVLQHAEKIGKIIHLAVMIDVCYQHVEM